MLDPETKTYLDEMARQSTAQHGMLMEEIVEMKTDIRGEPKRGIEGVIPKLDRHEGLLRKHEDALSILNKIMSKPGWVFVVAFIVILLISHLSTKGIDAILSTASKYFVK